MNKMKLFFKLLSIAFAVLLLALAAFIFTFDPNNYKDTIKAQVEKQTGRNFTIAGDISLSVFPWIGIQVEGVELANAEGFSTEPFARMSQLDVKVMLLPLLRKELQVDKVRLHGLFASLEIDEEGNNNWSDLTAHEDLGEAPPEQPPEDETEAAAQPPALAALAINGVELVDATVVWSDAQNKVHTHLSDFDLITGAVRFNEPVELQLSTGVKHNAPQLDALIKLTTSLTFNEALTNILLDAVELKISANAPELLKESLELAMQGTINIDTEQQLAAMNDMQLAFMDARLHAMLDINNLLSEPVITGNIHTEDINLRELLKRLAVELPPMAQANSLTRVAYTSRVKASAQQLELDDIRINLDDAEITGWLHLPELTQPVVRYKLALSPIIADAYLPPPAAENAESTAAAAAEGSAEAGAVQQEQDPEIALPVELLRKLDLQGELNMASVTVSGIPLTDVLMQTQAKGGVVRIDPLQLNTLEGNATSSVMLNVKADVPEYAIGVKASEIRPAPIMNPLLAGLFGQQDVTMDGAANVLADIKTQGKRVSELKRAALGNIRFDMGKTVLQGVDFEHYARNVVADHLAGRSLPVPDDWRGSFDPQTKTAFHRVHASADLANGDITNKDLVLDSSRVKVKGGGVINIVRNDMDYTALLDVEPAQRQTTAEKLLDQPLTVRIHGPFEELAYDVDRDQLKKTLTRMLEAEAMEKLEKEIEEEKAKLKQKADEREEEYKQKLENKLKDKLKGLF